ncbi:MAG: ABC transporter permease [Gammaproteobacteria bacterium]|nr:ABC transporter permease [Gammaproteobacteria bacterium]
MLTYLHRAFTRVCAIARVEALHIRRDRGTLALILTLPAVQLVLFGYTVNFTPLAVPLAISRAADTDDRWLMRAIESTGQFSVQGDRLPSGAAAAAVAAGQARVGIELPTASEADDESSYATRVIVDASDPNAVRPAVAALEVELARSAVRDVLNNSGPLVQVTWLYNPTGRTDWAITPVLAGVIVMISMLLLGALSLVREREQGTWEGLLLTPVTALEAILGKLAPYLSIAVLQTVVVIALAHQLFELPVRGAVTALLIGTIIFAAAHVVFGFALSAFAASQVQAVQLAVFFYLPSMLLSGFLFPFEGMPGWARRLGEALPLTHFARAARGALLRGEHAAEVLQHFIPVAIFLVGAGIAAHWTLRRRLD